VFSRQRSFAGAGIVAGKNGWALPTAASTSWGVKIPRTPGNRRGKTPEKRM
jgi:hypothetical protein